MKNFPLFTSHFVSFTNGIRPDCQHPDFVLMFLDQEIIAIVIAIITPQLHRAGQRGQRLHRRSLFHQIVVATDF